MNDASDAVFTISDDDAYEDNDTLVMAAALAPGTHAGLILRDEDYFKVYVEEGKDLQVSLSGGAALAGRAAATWTSSFTTPPGIFSSPPSAARPTKRSA